MQKLCFVLMALVFAATPAFAQNIKFLEAETLQAGKESQLTFRLAKNATEPLTLNDLKEVHKAKIHLLIVDDSLTDYQHLHPAPRQEKGQYVFSFTPKTPHNYTVWADITPVKGAHQYLKAVLSGASPCKTACIDAKPSLEGVDSGLKGVLTFDEPLKSGKPAMGTLAVSDEKGEPVKDLEPVMGAFAHIVGFYAETSDLVHIHPMGEEITNGEVRGGPELMFHVEPEHGGVLKLFAQVKSDGRVAFIPFTLNVAPK